MRIVVCIKQVPDTAEVKIDPETNNLVRQGIPSIMNPFDYTALAEALRLKRENGGTITVISMGPEQVKKELKMCLKMGADRAVLLSDRKMGGADTLATGYALAEAIKKIGGDLILCGNEAIDGCTGQVGPMIGEYLNIPAFTYVTGLQMDKNRLKISRKTECSQEVYTCSLPAAACMLKGGEELKEQETDREIEVWNADFLDHGRIGSAGSPTKVAGISVSEREKNFLHVDYRWDLETRMEYIFNGGLSVKETKIQRGSARMLAAKILGEGWVKYDQV
mgnify:FL=1